MVCPQVSVRVITILYVYQEYSDQENTYDFNHYFGTRREDDSHKHRDFAQDGGFLCPSEIKYAKPKRGKTAQGTWKDIVNVNDYTQTLRMEKCL